MNTQYANPLQRRAQVCDLANATGKENLRLLSVADESFNIPGQSCQKGRLLQCRRVLYLCDGYDATFPRMPESMFANLYGIQLLDTY